LVLEEGPLAEQGFVRRVRLDGGLGVGEEVLELLEDLAGGRGRAGGRGACGEERRARVSTSDDLDLP